MMVLVLLLWSVAGANGQSANAGPDLTVCPGDSAQIGGTPTGPAGSTYVWAPASGLSSTTIANPMAGPGSTTIYGVTVTDTAGVITTDSMTLTVANLPVTVANNTSLCPGDDFTLASFVSSSTSCGLDSATCSSPDTARVGAQLNHNGRSFTGTSGVKMQSIYRQSQLIAGGLAPGSVINGISYYVASPGAWSAVDQFTLRIRCDATDSTSTTFISGAFDTLIFPVTIGLNTGWNFFAFDQDFRWDGVNNLIVETCYDNNVAQNGAGTFIGTTLMSYPATVRRTGSNVCGSTVGTVGSYLPTARFHHCSPGNFNYSWSPSTGLSDPTQPNPVVTAQSTQTYVLTANDPVNNCTLTDSVTVTVENLSVTPPNDTMLCSSDSLVLAAVAGGTGPFTYSWSPSALLTNANIAAPAIVGEITADFTVSVSNGSGCTVEETIYVSHFGEPSFQFIDSTTICPGDSAPVFIEFQVSCGAGAGINPPTDTVEVGLVNAPVQPSEMWKGEAQESRSQSLWQPAELLAAGFQKGIITGFGFNMGTIGSNPIFENVRVRMACSPLPTLINNFVDSNLVTVKSGHSFNLQSGWNYIDFDTGFYWDGISAVLLETCYTNSMTGTAHLMSTQVVGFNAFVSTLTGNDCSAPSGFIGLRPAVRFLVDTTLGYSFQWSPISNVTPVNAYDPVMSPLQTTTYNFTALDPFNQCATITDSVLINVQPIVPVITPDTTVCNTDGFQLSAVVNNPGPVTYLWAPAAQLSNVSIPNPTITQDISLTYSLQISDTFGCTWNELVTVNSFPNPMITLTQDTTVCQFDTFNLSVSGGVSYAWSPGAGLSDTAISNPQASPDTTTDYGIVITDANGCTYVDSVLVVVAGSPTIELGNDTSICIGDSVYFSPGEDFLSWLWQDGSMNEGFWADTSGPIWVAVTTLCGADTDTVHINSLYIPPFPDLGNDTTLCDGEQNTVGGSLPSVVSYLWSDGSTDSLLTIDSAGTYWIEITDTNTCMASDTVVYNFSPFPEFELGNDTSFCIGNSLTLDATFPGASYTWSTGATTSTITVTTAGTYWCVDTSAFGCVWTDTITIGIDSLPVVDIGPDTSFCDGLSYTLDATGPSWTYAWSGGVGTPTLTVNLTNTYNVTVTDTNGCQSTDMATVTFTTLPQVTLDNDTAICQGETLVTNSNVTGLSVNWSTGDSTNQVSLNTAGTYTITVTDGNGCTDTDDIVLSLDTLPVVNLGNDTAFCIGPTLVINAAQANSTYLWSTGGTADSLAVNTSGTYTVTLTNANGCTGSDALTLTVDTLPVVTLPPDTAFCSGNFTVLFAGNPGGNYLWQGGQTSNSLTVATTGQYWVQVTTNAGCTGSDTFNLGLFPLPIVNLGPDLIGCQGDTFFLNAGNPGSTYTWSNGGVNQVQQAPIPSIYSVTVTDPNGCTGTDAALVSFTQPPMVNLGPDTSVCETQTIILDPGNSGGPGPQYQWSTGFFTNTFTPDTTGFYSVTVTDANGCTNEDVVFVEITEAPTLDLGPDEVVCDGEVVTWIIPTPNVDILWSTGSVDPVFSAKTSGTWWVTLSRGLCTISDTVSLLVNDVPELQLREDTTVCFTDLEGQGVVLDAGLTDGIYTWSTGDTSQVLEVFQAGTYMVTVTNGFQCIDADTVTISNECFSSIWFPKAFTPNDDLLNDGFRGFGDNIDNYHLMIFNRWGELLFETRDLTDEWNGKFNGNKVQEGVYVYRATYEVVTTPGFTPTKKVYGHVTLLRMNPNGQ